MRCICLRAREAKVRNWKVVGEFCVRRASDYAELATLELANTKATLLREIIVMVALVVGILFTLSFLWFA